MNESSVEKYTNHNICYKLSELESTFIEIIIVIIIMIIIIIIIIIII